jgi:CheY-like chemotaxis protein
LSIAYEHPPIAGQILTLELARELLRTVLELMDTIKLLLAHSDRRLSNQVEVAILDVCYNRAVVNSTRILRLDEFVHQGGLWDFDLMVLGAENLFVDRTQKECASPDGVAKAIAQVRQHRSTPIIALCANESSSEELLQAGADVVLCSPFNPDQLKAEVRSLLDLTSIMEPVSSTGWSAFGSLIRGFQKAKTAVH